MVAPGSNGRRVMNPGWMEGLNTLGSSKNSYHRTGKSWSVLLAREALGDAVRNLYEEEFFLEDIRAWTAPKASWQSIILTTF